MSRSLVVTWPTLCRNVLRITEILSLSGNRAAPPFLPLISKVTHNTSICDEHFEISGEILIEF